MLKIDVRTIDHSSHRYSTCGDYFEDMDETGSILQNNIRVSDMGNHKYEFLVALHEILEQFLCQDRNIVEREITLFDEEFEQERKLGIHTEDEEPGDSPMAPYRKEHFFATSIERLVAAELNVSWKDYEETISNLFVVKTKKRGKKK